MKPWLGSHNVSLQALALILGPKTVMPNIPNDARQAAIKRWARFTLIVIGVGLGAGLVVIVFIMVMTYFYGGIPVPP